MRLPRLSDFPRVFGATCARAELTSSLLVFFTHPSQMLKRSRCSIDLAQGRLFFNSADGRQASTPFLHEHDLPVSKGGTKGFDPNLGEEQQMDDSDAK